MVLHKGQVSQFAAEMLKKTAKSEIVNRILKNEREKGRIFGLFLLKREKSFP